ncbi:MAG: trypsin-like peptidase domain-containing protein [Flavobacteriales bacterium]|nr:trypsin-like peptidase domain-containing protein [Flavobacteriales bacterium]
MKKLFTTLCICFSLGMIAQFPVGYGLHPGFQNNIPLMELGTFDHAALLAEDTEIENNGGRTNNGRLIPINLNENDGLWSTLPDGSRLWQLRVRSTDALGLNVYFSGYHVPVGATMWMYNTSLTMFDGPYNHTDNNTHGHMCAGYVTGDEAIIEYHEPYGVVGTPGLEIRAIGHFYRYVYHDQDDRGSEFCEVDVNCPEGDLWQPEKDAVVRLLIVDGNFMGLCSGAFVNTIQMDCRPYILTALHCALGVSDEDFLDLSVRFNYEKSGCGTGAALSTHNKVGVFHRADSDDGGGQQGSDFLLIELEDEIPDSFTPFFAGFNATGTGSESGVCIHHPAGSAKKISTYEDNLSSVTYGSPGSHWEVEWVETETEWGVTEPGSSGSPLFNAAHQLVGHLTGGLSCCVPGACNDNSSATGPNKPDYYGKVSKDWDGNPNPTNWKLKEWLDPEGTGIEVMFGSYINEGLENPCGVDVGIRNEIKFEDVQVQPTASSGLVNIFCPAWHTVEVVNLFDATGSLVMNFSLKANSTTLDISHLTTGFYYITFIHTGGSHITKKISKA